MKIILVMSEAFLWKPKFVNDIINSLAVENKIVGVVLVPLSQERHHL